MRVVELTALHVRIPLCRPIGHATFRRTETDNLIVRCRLEDDTEGYGEGVPRDYVTGETIDGSLDLLRRSDLAAQLDSCRDFPHTLVMAEQLRLAPVPGDERGCQGNAARCAVELAILDAYGRHFGEPLSRVTPLLAPDLHEPRAWVRYSAAITSAKKLKLVVAATIYRLYGFRQLKVKVGIPGYEDLPRLARIRRIVGKRMDLRIDVNEAWSAADVETRLRELEPFGITAVEQPVPHSQVACLAEVRRHVPLPIMLDESLCSYSDGEQAIAKGLGDMFNLRLSKCGGFIPTLRLAQLAHRHGLGYQLGCQVGETAILSAAGRHFATSVAGLRYVEGSYDRHLVRERLGKVDITFGHGGWAPALAGPGLDVEPDPRALDRVTVRKEPILG